MKVSLRLKLMSLLIVVTSAMLLAYGGLALSDFSKDKIAYVYSTLLSQAKNTSGQVRSELDFVVSKIKFYMKGFSFEEGKFHAYSGYNLKTDSRVTNLWAFPAGATEFKPTHAIEKAKISETELEEIKRVFPSIFSEVISEKLSLRVLESNPEKWLVGLYFESKQGGKSSVIFALVEKSYFVEGIVSSEMQDTFLVSDGNKILIGPFSPLHVAENSQVENALQKSTKELGAKSGIFEMGKEGGEQWLVALTNVGVGGLKIISLVSKGVATSAVEILRVKSIFFFGVLVCLTIIISVLSSRSLTGALKKLLQSTRRIADGDFLVETDVKSGDEVGELAKGFNLMTVEIRRLLSETAEKARMENELLTAQTVQSTLFPKLEFATSNIEIRGFYQPASECGGDWFYYINIGSKTYMLIGDATGHGVPAALVTAAAKSASRVIEEFPDIPLYRVVEFLNRSIYETARGRVMMTFFVGCYDEENKEFIYVNASHDPPFLLPYTEDKLKKKDLVPLMGTTCKRLGERMDAEYVEERVQLQDGDRIVFYTDGVTELMNKENEMWGERNFVRTLLKSFNSDPNIENAMDNLAENISEHRQGHPLDDDLTYFMFQTKV